MKNLLIRKLVVLGLLILLNVYVGSMRHVEAVPGDCEQCIATDPGSGICILRAQHTDSVADFLRTFEGQQVEAAQQAVISEFIKQLKQQQVTG